MCQQRRSSTPKRRSVHSQLFKWHATEILFLVVRETTHNVPKKKHHYLSHPSLEGHFHARRAFILTQPTLLRFPSFLGQASVQYPHVFAWKEGSSGSIFSHPIHPPFPFLSILHLVLLYAVINSSFIPVAHTKARKSTNILK